jgi:uncharacterized membrane protein YukC
MEEKIDAVYASVEKTRKHFQVVMWVTIGMVVLPLLALVFVVPTFIRMYTNTLNGLM